MTFFDLRGTKAMLGSRGSGQKFCCPWHFKGLAVLGTSISWLASGCTNLAINQLNISHEFDLNSMNQLLQCGAPKIAKLVYNDNNYDIWYL